MTLNSIDPTATAFTEHPASRPPVRGGTCAVFDPSGWLVGSGNTDAHLSPRPRSARDNRPAAGVYVVRYVRDGSVSLRAAVLSR